MTLTPEEEEFARLRDNPQDLAPEVAQVIFATDWDDAVEFYRQVAQAAGLTHEEFLAMLDQNRVILQKYVTIPRPMTVEKSRPFVELSDMLTLARLARYCYDQVDKLDIDLSQ